MGSVSGGCIEDDLIDRVRREGITRTRPEIVTYGVTADEAHRFGLPCGGTIQLAVEPLVGARWMGPLLARLANRELLAVEVIHTMPDDLVIDMQLDHRSAVIALTHDPKLDDLALMEALKSRAFYVGAIGSRVNSARRRERLQEFDVSEAQVAKLRGPIGLFIGSKTPPEIAISILAELTAAKNGVALPDAMRTAGGKQVIADGTSCSVSR